MEESAVVNQAMLQETGWHVEAEESLPMTFAERSERMAQLATENPQLAGQVGMGHPMNIPKVHQMFGVEDFYQPGENEREKMMEVIQQLLNEEPVLESTPQIDPATGAPVIDQMTGMPAVTMQERPSIMPDEFEDRDHTLCGEIIRSWTNSKVGRVARKAKPRGYDNVVLYGKLHDMMAMPPPMPGPAPGPDGKLPEGEKPPQDSSMGPPLPPVEEPTPVAA